MEKIKLEAKTNQRDTCMIEMYDNSESSCNTLWFVVHEDLFLSSPETLKRMRDGETIKFTLQVDEV